MEKTLLKLLPLSNVQHLKPGKILFMEAGMQLLVKM